MSTADKWSDPWELEYHIKTQADDLSDGDLQLVNASYPWASHTLDGKGRVIGNKNGRRYYPLCRLVEAFDEWVDCEVVGGYMPEQQYVAEYGCYEGAYTAGLSFSGYQVTAIDSRPLNIANSAARVAIYGERANFALVNLEKDPPQQADLAFHSGVLYHLTDPVAHLFALSERTRLGIMLDFTYSPTTEQSYISGGKSYPCHVNREGGVGAPKSGMREIARWLKPDLVMDILQRRWVHVDQVNDRDESQQNGAIVRRATVLAHGRM